MSGRSGGGQARGATLGPQPIKATIPYQLSGRARPGRREGRPSGKAQGQPPDPGMRRTMSLDAIVGPYLQGQWPKEAEVQGVQSRRDQSTQTPDSWADRTQRSSSSSSSSSSRHKRSASWGSAEHLQEIAKLKQQLQQRSKPGVSGGHDRDRQRGYPQGSCSLGTTRTQPIPIPHAPLSTLVPRLRCSVEGLNQELEGMFICQTTNQQQRLLEVPDGHRAPLPQQSGGGGGGGSQSDSSSVTPLSSSPSPPPTSVSTSPPDSEDALLDPRPDRAQRSPFSQGRVSLSEADLSSPLLNASSPGPNKSCCFQREPPEGCEKVRVWEESSTGSQPKPALISSCPDPNKINFTPHGGSAFCPVSLLKPLLPSMDLLLCSLAASAAGGCSGPGTLSCQGTISGNPAGSPDPPGL